MQERALPRLGTGGSARVSTVQLWRCSSRPGAASPGPSEEQRQRARALGMNAGPGNARAELLGTFFPKKRWFLSLFFSSWEKEEAKCLVFGS